MNLIRYAFDLFASSMTILLELMVYSKISNKKIVFNIINIIILLLAGLFVMMNTYYNESLMRTFISFTIVLVTSLMLFKDDLKKIFYSLIIFYVVATIYEILLSSLISAFYIFDLSTFDQHSIIKALFSFLTLIFSYLTFSIKKINSFTNKSIVFLIKNRIITILLITLFISLIVIDFKYSVSFSKRIYMGNILLVISLCFLFIVGISNNLKVNKEKEKSEVLLSFMSKYEKMIDDNRINKHELLNNLLVLKSIKNKKSKIYNDTLDELIDKYSIKGIKIKNIYNLPSGLKGIIYYKLYGLDEKGFNIIINVSKDANKMFKNISHDEYVSLYKMIGIILDNAIEASEKSKEKYILIDVYNKNSETVLEVSNTYVGHIDINKINKKYYSTKGNGRGLGLYILKNIYNSSQNISIEQNINNNIFTCKIIIKE